MSDENIHRHSSAEENCPLVCVEMQSRVVSLLSFDTQVELRASFRIQRNISADEITSASSSSKLSDGNVIVCQPATFSFFFHSLHQDQP